MGSVVCVLHTAYANRDTTCLYCNVSTFGLSTYGIPIPPLLNKNEKREKEKIVDFLFFKKNYFWCKISSLRLML